MSKSATVPTADQTEADVLHLRAEIWGHRLLLRQIYENYFREMISHLASRDAEPFPDYGRVVELGGGSGNFKSFFPQAIATDIVPTPLVDLTVDALRMPFGADSVDNLVMQDVLHHLPYPLRFFAEAQRVLRPGGRIIMTEPYISPFSRLVFKLAHPEPVIPSARIFGDSAANDPPAFTGQGAFASNQAIPTLLFFRDLQKFQTRFPRLIIRQRLLRSLWVYPLSGGFSGPQMIPGFAIPLAWQFEKMLRPAARLMAFRLLMVLEKR